MNAKAPLVVGSDRSSGSYLDDVGMSSVDHLPHGLLSPGVLTRN